MNSNGRITLIRHGRSAHAVRGLLDLAAFRKWREDYEAAGLANEERAPVEVMTLPGVVVASDVRRAIESARLLGREVIASPLLRELALEPVKLERVQLPLIGWALTYAFRRPLATHDEQERARDAADWLTAMEGDVLAFTHHSFRGLLAKELTSRGWVSTSKRGRAHWSAWTFTAP